MALEPEQAEIYKDLVTAYRSTGKDANGDDLGLAPVVGLMDVPCKLYTTRFFDSPRASVGRQNRPNPMLADQVHTEARLPFLASDTLRATQFGSGGVSWYSVTGPPQVRPGDDVAPANYQSLYVQLTNPPNLT